MCLKVFRSEYLSSFRQLMLKKISSYKPSEFKKNVAVIFSGSVAAQIIVIVATPILSRLYTPEQYGIYGLFLSIVAVTGILSSFRYTNAIQITPEHNDAQSLMSFCQFSIIGFSVLMFLGLLIAIYGLFDPAFGPRA